MPQENKKTLTQEPQGLKLWRQKYIEAAVDALRPSGDVLQVGFNEGIAADRIQKARVKSHTIIEPDAKLAEEARKWAANTGFTVTVIRNTWQAALPSLKTFDVIFFDDNVVDSGLDIMRHLNPEELNQTSNQAKELLKGLESLISQIKVQYSDQQIDKFYQDVGQFNAAELPKFFERLKKNGHISKDQYDRVMKKYHLENKDSTKNANDNKISSLLAFLQESLKGHMNKGSRFSGILGSAVSNFEDPQFFENIITNPALDYREESINIEAPGLKNTKAIVFVVEQTG